MKIVTIPSRTEQQIKQETAAEIRSLIEHICYSNNPDEITFRIENDQHGIQDRILTTITENYQLSEASK